MSKAAAAPDETLTIQGIKALDRALGTAGAHRFLTLARPSPTDYVKISRKLYAGQTVSDIFVRSKGRARSR
ncbi:MAG: hypothetical protein ABSH19_04815 [Opitutales bacterium]|jgi:hypothetical protein